MFRRCDWQDREFEKIKLRGPMHFISSKDYSYIFSQLYELTHLSHNFCKEIGDQALAIHLLKAQLPFHYPGYYSVRLSLASTTLSLPLSSPTSSESSVG